MGPFCLKQTKMSRLKKMARIKKRLERSGATAAEIEQFFKNIEKKVKEEKAREKAAERMATVEEERLEEMDAVKEAKSEDGKATEEAEARTEAAEEEKSEVYAREEFQLASQTVQRYYEKILNA